MREVVKRVRLSRERAIKGGKWVWNEGDRLVNRQGGRNVARGIGRK